MMEPADTESAPQPESPQHQEEDMVTEEPTPLEDIVLINDQTIEKLTHGLMAHYLPDLQDSKQALQELTQNQVILLDTLEQEVAKFKDCNALLDLNALFTEAKIYHTKLVNIRKEMMIIHDKTTKLKKRALKLQQQRQKEALEKEQQREKEMERERQLIAKPAKRS
ncbi:biogenesis of lysosome-related organelles complex 1 subunit 6 [Engraulis encrasicolus]|uniref:biogenesis of lysosome-related organelles complex 1 subunit 6 n=1 Tax=Engraulis encrasicolus TaxID=184585 RepID=UPI002FD12821